MELLSNLLLGLVLVTIILVLIAVSATLVLEYIKNLMEK